MTEKQAKSLIKRINEKNGDDVARIYKGYSGRGMFGDTTFGVVAPGWAFSERAYKKYRRDNLGLDMIVY